MSSAQVIDSCILVNFTVLYGGQNHERNETEKSSITPPCLTRYTVTAICDALELVISHSTIYFRGLKSQHANNALIWSAHARNNSCQVERTRACLHASTPDIQSRRLLFEDYYACTFDWRITPIAFTKNHWKVKYNHSKSCFWYELKGVPFVGKIYLYMIWWFIELWLHLSKIIES